MNLNLCGAPRPVADRPSGESPPASFVRRVGSAAAGAATARSHRNVKDGQRTAAASTAADRHHTAAAAATRWLCGSRRSRRSRCWRQPLCMYRRGRPSRSTTTANAAARQLAVFAVYVRRRRHRAVGLRPGTSFSGDALCRTCKSVSAVRRAPATPQYIWSRLHVSPTCTPRNSNNRARTCTRNVVKRALQPSGRAAHLHFLARIDTFTAKQRAQGQVSKL